MRLSWHSADDEKRLLRIHNKCLKRALTKQQEKNKLLEEKLKLIKKTHGKVNVTRQLNKVLQDKKNKKRHNLKQKQIHKPALPRRFCEGCFDKQQRIDKLEEAIILLKNKLRYRERSAKEGPFGLATPSSKIPTKSNSSEDNQSKKGGAVDGHVGHGRPGVNECTPDRVVNTNTEHVVCPDCGGNLRSKDTRRRIVIDLPPVNKETTLHNLERKECVDCGKVIQANPPGVLPKSLFGNQLLTQFVVQHYVYGITIGTLSKQYNIGVGSIINALHNLAKMFESVYPRLIEDYRNAIVRHADETGWRNDGLNGYAWLFCTLLHSIYCFSNTRSSKIPKEIFGDTKDGFLVVDRYAGYNCLLVLLQYCYVHLIRDLKKLELQFPSVPEITSFVEILTPQLANAIALHKEKLSDKKYYKKSKIIKRRILRIINSPANHPGIQQIQDIFRRNKDRMYNWVIDRNVPAENNFAERELRPTVISRKISFGSQSDKGAKTRERLMSVIHSLRKQTPGFVNKFKTVLDKLSENPKLDPYKLFFSSS
ncbi:MAG: IS66 family transposase [Bacteroidales bacterium]|nr:IS66 family transposase [Bacteroidales bacterium]